MKHIKRFLLALLLTVIVLVMGIVVSVGLEFVYNFQFGLIVAGATVLTALFGLCWYVVGGFLD